MSSFIHSNEQFNSVEKGLVTYLKKDEDFSYSLKPLSKRKLTVDMVKSFVDTLRKLSVLCVSLQYKDHYENLDAEINEQTEILFRDTETHVKLNPVDLIMAISSIDYQIEIEHLKELRDLDSDEDYAMELIGVLPHAIAYHEMTNTKAYDDSKAWSL